MRGPNQTISPGASLTMQKFMSRCAVAAITALALSAAVHAQTPAAPPAAAATPAMDEATKMNYALGYQLGRDLASTEVRAESLLKGVEDGRTGAKSLLSDEEMRASLMALEQQINANRAKTQAAAAAKAQAEGATYLAANAKKSGVKTTASGLQYRMVAPGKGRTPTPSDTVTVHYKGTLVDGTEFDSSYKRGEPATFPLNAVIPGWTEALQLMQEGSKYELVIPADLAYGDQGPLANQVLLFEVELLSAAPTAEGDAK
jgi:FKBP-type peptidyl-prolyl cis-trans isomerase FklB